MPAVVSGAASQQEVHVDRQLLALSVRPVLGLLHHSHLRGQLRKHHAAGRAEVQARACKALLSLGGAVPALKLQPRTQC